MLVALFVVVPTVRGDDLDKRILKMEEERIGVIKSVQPAVVAVLTGGGSGVLISDDGYALTNFHVTEAAHGPFMKCGLPDGVLYDAVLVGLDKVGDVALIKLLPKKSGDKFPYAKLGDSDKVQAGDWSLAMGNPFLLANDFTPTVTYGLVSGVHRYQYPAGTLLEYTDCIQIDTSINPGNSGGPLFNMKGELIGINGRGSFEKRGRVNSGVGYAISINQIKNFLPQLKAGMDTDHASPGFRIETDEEEGSIPKFIVKQIIPSDAMRRGLDVDDQVVGLRRPADSQYQSVQEHPRSVSQGLAHAGRLSPRQRKEANGDARSPHSSDGRAASRTAAASRDNRGSQADRDSGRQASRPSRTHRRASSTRPRAVSPIFTSTSASRNVC